MGVEGGSFIVEKSSKGEQEGKELDYIIFHSYSR